MSLVHSAEVDGEIRADDDSERTLGESIGETECQYSPLEDEKKCVLAAGYDDVLCSSR